MFFSGRPLLTTKRKKMKRLIATIIIQILITALFYLVGSFAAWDFTIANWHWFIKLTVIALYTYVSIVNIIQEIQ